MRLKWQIEQKDIDAIRELRRQHGERPFVRRRIARNVQQKRRRVSDERIWTVHLGCLLSTQQRSGPGSAVQRFLDSTPFPLALDRCCMARSPHRFIERELARFGGLRWSPKNAAFAAHNLEWLQQGGWRQLALWRRNLQQRPGRSVERAAAHYVAKHLMGFGPKQSRNFWQWLGYTRFEIPIDSRVISWLNSIDFPIKLSSTGLSDPNYYEFVLDAVQRLCRAARVDPCVFDALVFASFDKDDWSARNRVW